MTKVRRWDPYLHRLQLLYRTDTCTDRGPSTDSESLLVIISFAICCFHPCLLVVSDLARSFAGYLSLSPSTLLTDLLTNCPQLSPWCRNTLCPRTYVLTDPITDCHCPKCPSPNWPILWHSSYSPDHLLYYCLLIHPSLIILCNFKSSISPNFPSILSSSGYPPVPVLPQS